jgi:hypothetical protein
MPPHVLTCRQFGQKYSPEWILCLLREVTEVETGAVPVFSGISDPTDAYR